MKNNNRFQNKDNSCRKNFYASIIWKRVKSIELRNYLKGKRMTLSSQLLISPKGFRNFYNLMHLIRMKNSFYSIDHDRLP